MQTQTLLIGFLTFGGYLALISATTAVLIIALQYTQETQTFSLNGTTPSAARGKR